MASACPRCHQIVADDVVCCAELRYTWKCTQCSKVSTGFALPYGRCFLCGGHLIQASGQEFDDPVKVRPIRDAVQFELNSYHFYRLARRKVSDPLLLAIFTQLYLHEVDHLQTLQDRYHTHLDENVLDLPPDEEELLSGFLFRDINFEEEGGPLALYDQAIEMERRARDHFRKLADELPDGPEREVCGELAAEEEEHVALLETEREQFVEA